LLIRWKAFLVAVSIVVSWAPDGSGRALMSFCPMVTQTMVRGREEFAKNLLSCG
jgi:hypothetical protein